MQSIRDRVRDLADRMRAHNRHRTARIVWARVDRQTFNEALDSLPVSGQFTMGLGDGTTLLLGYTRDRAHIVPPMEAIENYARGQYAICVDGFEVESGVRVEVA